MHVRLCSTGHASGTDYAIVTCDRYSAPQHGRFDCCSPAVVTGLVHLMSRIQQSALFTAAFTIGMCRPTAAVDQVRLIIVPRSSVVLHFTTYAISYTCQSVINHLVINLIRKNAAIKQQVS